MNEHRGASYRQIILVSIVLAVLTGIEYVVALSFPSAVFLLLIALVKAAIIVQFFMHIYRLWREESH